MSEVSKKTEASRDPVLSTQEAANLVGAFRPYIVARIDAGDIPLHQRVGKQRPDKRPGEWKDQINQAGSTVFVLPELVPGTLRGAFERILALVDPVARAPMTMLVVSAVHLFVDGNGRTARLAMNCVLSAAGLSRIIVTAVYRGDCWPAAWRC